MKLGRGDAINKIRKADLLGGIKIPANMKDKGINSLMRLEGVWEFELKWAR